MDLTCVNCGRTIETIPLSCGLGITLNGNTHKWECDLGDCGVRSIEDILCVNCCTKLS
ncbi:MAG: SCP-2 sterol transfer family protein [Promethearchaeota archaeon]|nr:MAG: SCP-2 sterol transfer family protein [Candidatus Lokiarchaeota archaeon]